MATQKFDIYDGLVYETPPIPPISQIRGSHLKKKDQVWYRSEPDSEWDWNDNPKSGVVWWDDPSDGQLEWYYAEIDKILNGEWVMINGIPTFFNNFCYFFHNFFITKEGQHPYYKDTSLEFFRFIEIVFKDPKCRGANVMKGRRVGVSSMCMSIMLQFGLIKSNTEQGITSKSAIDAEKIFKLMLVNAYARLPSYLKPRISGNDMPVKTMHITKQAGRITKDGGTGANKEGLNNKLEWRAPGLNVFDGDGLWVLLVDEAAKIEDFDVSAYLEIAMKIIHAGRQIGRILMITTVNRGDKGGDNYKPIWYNSDYTKLDQIGQTSSKLYRLFIAGYRGMDGWMDKYGNSVVDTSTQEQTEWLKNDPNCLDPNMGCKAYCELQRKIKAKDPEKLQEEIRMVPFNPEEVFKGANNACYFNIDELNNQKERIETKLEYASLYKKGWFREDQGGNVYFQNAPLGTPDKNTEFMWYIIDMPDPKDSNRFIWQAGQRTPTNTDYGVMGADLVMNSEKTAEKGSDAAMCIFKRYNALDPENSGMVSALGIGRPSSVTFMHEQLFLALRYYGIKALIERSPIAWYDYAKDKKLLGYCIKTNLKMSGEDRYGVAVQDGEAREQHLTEQIEYASGNMGKIWYIRIIDDMFGFNVKDRTIYDACMAFGYALMGLKDRHRPVVHDGGDVQIIRLYNLHEKYGGRR